MIYRRLSVLFHYADGISCDHQFFVGRDQQDLDLGIHSADDGFVASQVVSFRIQFDAQVFHVRTDLRSHADGVFTDASCEYDYVCAVQFRQICADEGLDLLCENVQSQLCSFIAVANGGRSKPALWLRSELGRAWREVPVWHS